MIRDTIYLNTNDTAKSKIIRKAKPDTVFIRQKSTPSVNGQNGNRE